METAIRLTRIYPGRFKFIWAGDGAGLREMKKLAEEYVDISFLGFQEHVAALYREADIYFQPSKSESQGIAVVEALSAGLPCVVSSAGGLPESIEDGVEGFVCEPSAVDQYVQAFLRLFENSELRVQLGINAREKYKKLFTRETWEAKMTALIKEIV